MKKDHENLSKQTKAICYNCEKVVDTIEKVRDLKISDEDGIVKSLSVKVCPECDKTVAMPHSETPKIKEHLSKNK